MPNGNTTQSGDTNLQAMRQGLAGLGALETGFLPAYFGEFFTPLKLVEGYRQTLKFKKDEKGNEFSLYAEAGKSISFSVSLLSTNFICPLISLSSSATLGTASFTSRYFLIHRAFNKKILNSPIELEPVFFGMFAGTRKTVSGGLSVSLGSKVSVAAPIGIDAIGLDLSFGVGASTAVNCAVTLLKLEDYNRGWYDSALDKDLEKLYIASLATSISGIGLILEFLDHFTGILYNLKESIEARISVGATGLNTLLEFTKNIISEAEKEKNKLRSGQKYRWLSKLAFGRISIQETFDASNWEKILNGTVTTGIPASNWLSDIQNTIPSDTSYPEKPALLSLFTTYSTTLNELNDEPTAADDNSACTINLSEINPSSSAGLSVTAVASGGNAGVNGIASLGMQGALKVANSRYAIQQNDIYFTQDTITYFQKIQFSSGVQVTGYVDRLSRKVTGWGGPSRTYVDKMTYQSVSLYWDKQTATTVGILDGSGVSFGFSLTADTLIQLGKNLSNPSDDDQQDVTNNYLENFSAALRINVIELQQFILDIFRPDKLTDQDKEALEKYSAILIESSFEFTDSFKQTLNSSTLLTDDQLVSLPDCSVINSQVLDKDLDDTQLATVILPQLLRIRVREADRGPGSNTAFTLGLKEIGGSLSFNTTKSAGNTKVYTLCNYPLRDFTRGAVYQRGFEAYEVPPVFLLPHLF